MKKTNYIETLNAIPAAGKTHAAITYIKETFGITKSKILYVLPTKEVINEVYNKLLEQGIEQVTKIYGDDNISTSVQERIVDFVINQESPYILMITNRAAMMLSDRLTGFDLVVIDEEIPSFGVTERHLPTNNEDQMASCEYFFTYISRTTTCFKGLSKLSLNHSSYKNINKEDEIYKVFNEMFENMDKGTFDYYILDNELDKLLDEESDTNSLHIMSIMRPTFFKQQKEVIYLGYDIENANSSLVYKALYNYQFKQSKLEKKLRFKQYSNKVVISYIFNERIGKQAISNNERLQQQVKEYVENNSFNNDCLYRTNIKMKSKVKFFNSEEIMAKPHGINNPKWTQKTKIVLLNLFYTNPYESMFFQNMGYEPADIEAGRNVNMIVQQITRSAIRHNTGETINVLVLDQNTALSAASAFANVTVQDSGLIPDKGPRQTRSDKLDKEFAEKCTECKKMDYNFSRKKKITKQQQEEWLETLKVWKALSNKLTDQDYNKKLNKALNATIKG
ncbi:DEAD/DEAH box helicase [Novacetimonas hansenii]|uniref:DEAD/DEAH-box helicase domain-containing protein n=1 Tax=Novacetimonas hansenii TaxID=436 RepID=A0ABQ0SH72_NOVHA|nr:DEAD/DEAH box helicase family protein [Novacetimonas hansenii]GAN84008.1 hypothetical protein Gaha_0122_008 [Novacetimonas hansenii JCM 7643]GBQ55913.1 hypothetical protein AA0243_1050 [Novacetimonas hansenii NRIC 0243]GEC64588.1 hypothetical protein GHA01_24370 [Novacetimonas hansenii]